MAEEDGISTSGGGSIQDTGNKDSSQERKSRQVTCYCYKCVSERLARLRAQLPDPVVFLLTLVLILLIVEWFHAALFITKIWIIKAVFFPGKKDSEDLKDGKEGEIEKPDSDPETQEHLKASSTSDSRSVAGDSDNGLESEPDAEGQEAESEPEDREPVLEPESQESESEPEHQDPEPEPEHQDPEPEPERQEPEPEPERQEPEPEPERQEPEPEPERQEPEPEPERQEPEPEPERQEPEPEPENKKPSKHAANYFKNLAELLNILEHANPPKNKNHHQQKNRPFGRMVDSDLDSDEELLSEQSIYRRYDDPLSEDFEMDPAMVTNEKKIEWKGDGKTLSGNEILKAFNRGKKATSESKSETPKYDPKRVPKGLDDAQKFLQDPDALNFCFLPKDSFIRICSMLPVSTFVNLSSTCRYLRWRMFAFCTCYIRNPVIVKLKTNKVLEHKKFCVMPSKVYKTRVFGSRQQSAGLFAYVPPCLQKPFFCETLIIKMEFYTYDKDDYNRALAVILPLRPFARRVFVYHDARTSRYQQGLDYNATNNFYKNINATSFRYWDQMGFAGVQIFMKCPIAREMDMVWLDGLYDLVDITPLNRIGYYCHAKAEDVERAINAFLYGIQNLEFHVYYRLKDAIFNSSYKIVGFHLLEYLFTRYDGWEEYFSDKDDAHHWYTTIQENGRRIKLRIYRKYGKPGAGVMIGKEELFDKMEKHYNSYYHKSQRYIRQYGEKRTDRVWKMDTAVEPEE